MKNKLINYYWNFKSKKTSRKFLVLESDDWGSLRTESKSQLKFLNKLNNSVIKDPYVQMDGLAGVEDLNHLFDTLIQFKDKNGNAPLITANVCTANPDFKRIKENKFNHFYYESFQKTINNQKFGDATLNLWKEGQQNKLFYPQLHGREHVHALAWLNELKKGNKELLNAFELDTWGIPYTALNIQRRKNLQASLDSYNISREFEFQQQWLIDAVEIFHDSFNYKSRSFIAPAYIWDSKFHLIMNKLEIESLQGIKLQYQPTKNSYKRTVRFLGEKDKKNNIKFFPRNVFFEPALWPKQDWFSKTLEGIDVAFKNNQPAIVGSHRINFIGKLNEKNRVNNLLLLKKILHEVINKYPDVEFVSSDQLIDYF